MIEKRKQISKSLFHNVLVYSKDYVIEEKEQCLNSDDACYDNGRDTSFNKESPLQPWSEREGEKEREHYTFTIMQRLNAIIAVDRSSKNNIKRENRNTEFDRFKMISPWFVSILLKNTREIQEE